MSSLNVFRLFLLAAIWGASFLFMRIAVPSFGPIALMTVRIASAALFLCAIALASKRMLQTKHAKTYFIVGILNTALPFVLFAYAAKNLNASLLSILNATAPIFGAIISWLWLKQPMTLKTAIGLILGLSGVAMIMGFDPSIVNKESYLAIAAGLTAACSYGLSSNYLKRSNPGIQPFDITHGSLWGGTLVLLPFVIFAVPTNPVPVLAWEAAITLGILCTAIAYLLFFKLMAELGPMRTLTVTFLIPAFGVLWGHIFLNEPVGIHTFIGMFTVICGTALVTGFSIKSLFSKPAN